MKKPALIIMAFAAIFLSSCDTLKTDRTDKAVVHVFMHYGDATNSTSFEYLDVKANIKVAGTEQSFTVTTNDFTKDFTVTSFPASVEIGSTFTLKSAYNAEETLPEKYNLILAVAKEPVFGMDINNVVVDYYSGDKLVKSETVSLSSSSGSTNLIGYHAKQAGLAKTLTSLSKHSENKYTGTVK